MRGAQVHGGGADLGMTCRVRIVPPLLHHSAGTVSPNDDTTGRQVLYLQRLKLVKLCVLARYSSVSFPRRTTSSSSSGPPPSVISSSVVSSAYEGNKTDRQCVSSVSIGSLNRFDRSRALLSNHCSLRSFITFFTTRAVTSATVVVD